MEIEEIYTYARKSPSKRILWNGIYSLLIRADARGSADTIVNDVTKVGHARNIYYQRILL